jgi:hypothetical protein
MMAPWFVIEFFASVSMKARVLVKATIVERA